MDPYSSPYRIPNSSPQYPFPHSLLEPDSKLQSDEIPEESREL